MKTLKLPFLLLTLVTLLVASAQEETSPSPEEVVIQFMENFNNGDYEATTKLMAEDVIQTFVPVFFQPPIVSNRDALLVYEQLSPFEPQVEIVPQPLFGEDIVVTHTRIWNNEMQAMGIDVLEFTEIYIVRGGHIIGITSIMTPESLELALTTMAEMEDE